MWKEQLSFVKNEVESASLRVAEWTWDEKPHWKVEKFQFHMAVHIFNK